MIPDRRHLMQPIVTVSRKDVSTLRESLSVAEALEMIRAQGDAVGEKVVYFYVTDDDDHLVGVLPTRRLLTAAPHTLLREIMVKRVLTLPERATILEGCEAFVMHKLLAFPVVDKERHIVGVVDVGLLADEAFDLAEMEETDALFESIGFRISQVRDARRGVRVDRRVNRVVLARHGHRGGGDRGEYFSVAVHGLLPRTFGAVLAARDEVGSESGGGSVDLGADGCVHDRVLLRARGGFFERKRRVVRCGFARGRE